MQVLTKNELKKGMKVKMEWKGKIYEGIIINEPKDDAKESARLTRGRFISIKIQTDTGKILNMPYTNRAKYYVLN